MQKISVIIPVYNAASTLSGCLQALVDQVQPNDDLEIIVVDNNSTDDSLGIAQSFVGVQVLSEPKQGAYAARNKGCQVATGDILAFTDPDCIPGSDWIKEIDRAFGDKRVALVMGRQCHAGRSSALHLIEHYEREKVSYVYGQKDPSVFFGYCNNMAVRRWLWEDMGPFVERLRGADVIFIRRCVDRYSTDLAKYIPDMTVRHLEITGLKKYYHKMWIYGRSRRRYSHIVRARPLSAGERLSLFRQAARQRQYSLYQYFGLLLLLIGGWLFWLSGSLSALWDPGEK